MATPTGATTASTYDAVGQLLSVTDANNVVSRFGYDNAGNRTRMTDGLGRSTRTDYDVAGRIVKESDLDPTRSRCAASPTPTTSRVTCSRLPRPAATRRRTPTTPSAGWRSRSSR